MEQRKLYKSSTDKALFGVCGGLAEYFGVDSLIVRLVFVLVSFGFGTGVGIYLLAALLMPSRPQGAPGYGYANAQNPGARYDGSTAGNGTYAQNNTYSQTQGSASGWQSSSGDGQHSTAYMGGQNTGYSYGQSSGFAYGQDAGSGNGQQAPAGDASGVQDAEYTKVEDEVPDFQGADAAAAAAQTAQTAETAQSAAESEPAQSAFSAYQEAADNAARVFTGEASSMEEAAAMNEAERARVRQKVEEVHSQQTASRQNAGTGSSGAAGAPGSGFGASGAAGASGFSSAASNTSGSAYRTSQNYTYQAQPQGSQSYSYHAQPQQPQETKKSSASKGKSTLGVCLLAVGAVVLLREFVPWISRSIVFALALIIIGSYILFTKDR